MRAIGEFPGKAPVNNTDIRIRTLLFTVYHEKIQLKHYGN